MKSKKYKLFITGHNGLVGSNLLSYFNKKYNCITINRKKLDLKNKKKLNTFLKKHKIDIIIHAAAKAGGIHANSTSKIEMFVENVEIQNSLFQCGYKNKIKKIIFLGSSCIYPKFSKHPISEDEILNGSLEQTNEGYALAKISGVRLCKYYNEKFNTDYRAVMPCNLYGKNDKYHALDSHVIPSLIKKFIEGKNKNSKNVEIWGTGKPLREFMHVNDLCEAIEKIIKVSKKKFRKICGNNFLVNVGTEKNISIKKLANIIRKEVKFFGKIKFNKKYPDGVKNKLLNCNKLRKLTNWKPKIQIKKGIKEIILEYEKKVNV